MIILLFPTMTALTTGHVLAPIDIVCDEGAGLPVLAEAFDVVVEDVRVASEVLPVVIINTLRLVMVFVERTALRLEVEHIEVRIPLHLMNKAGLKLLGAVRE